MMNLLLCCGGPTPKLFIGEKKDDSLERVFDNFLWFGCGFPKDTPKNSPKFFLCVWSKDDSQSVSSIWLSFLTQRPTYVP